MGIHIKGKLENVLAIYVIQCHLHTSPTGELDFLSIIQVAFNTLLSSRYIGWNEGRL